jgi:hypothetical protein
MALTRKQFLDTAGRGALGAALYSTVGFPGRVEGQETSQGASSPPSERGYSFHASASALGGRFTRPFQEVIEVQAASALTRVGGYDSARVGKFRYREIVSFESAYTQVIGSEHTDREGTVYETLSSSVVVGLDVQGMVTADRVVARLTSRRRLASSPNEDLPMLPLGSYFENLRIAGVRIDLNIHDRLLRDETMSAIKSGLREYPDSEQQQQSAGGDRLQLSIFDDSGLLEERADPKAQGGRREKIPGVRSTRACQIVVPNFGRIFLGEYFVEKHSRELTMIRLELGSPGAGSIAVCGAQGDGRPS